jgi:hypothetical protein
MSVSIGGTMATFTASGTQTTEKIVGLLASSMLVSLILLLLIRTDLKQAV